MSFNQVTLMGNLVRDPEIKFTDTGNPVGSFSIALNDTWKDKQGERQEYVNYIDCEVWGKTAESISEYFKKGDPIIISGSLKQQRWQDKETDQKRSKVVVRVHGFTFIPRTRQKAEEVEGPTYEVSTEAPPF